MLQPFVALGETLEGRVKSRLKVLACLKLTPCLFDERI